MKSLRTPSKGSQPLSRYGDRVATILPSVLPATPLQERREGFTDLSRMHGTESLPPRAILLTRQGISLRPVTSTYVEGLVISANLCMSPCSSDSIFTHLHCECLAYSL